MKKIVLSAIIGALAVLAAIVIGIQVPIHTNRYQHIDYISTITSEKCYICGENKKFSGAFYWGENNVGIVNLNTFELLRLEIVRYDGFGKHITGTAGYMSSSSLSDPENEAYVHAFTFPDNNYSDVTLTGVSYTIDRDAIQMRLCQSCLDSINSMDFAGHPPAEYAILNFRDRTIHPLLSSSKQLSSGDYTINCEIRNSEKIDLFILYCPNLA